MMVSRKWPLARVAAAALVLLALSSCDGSDPTPPPEPGTLATRLVIAEGNDQQGVVATLLAQPIVVRVTDDQGRPVPGQAVAFRVTSGGGVVNAGAGISDAFGHARDRWTLGTSTAEAQQVEARLIHGTTGEIIATQIFRATPRAGPVASVTKHSGDGQRARPGTAVADSLAVRVADQYGNPVQGAAVAWTALAQGGSTSPASSTSNNLGIAKTRLTVGTVAGQQQVRFTVGALSGTFIAWAVKAPQGNIVATQALGARPFGLAINQAGRTYITQLDAAMLTRMDLPSFNFGSNVGVGLVPTDVTFNPSGTKAYVADQFSQGVSVIDVASNTRERVIPVPGDPKTSIVSPDDTRLYVLTNANRVFQIDLSTDQITASIPFSQTPNGLAFHPNGYILYVSTRLGGTTAEIDTRNMTVLRSFFGGGLTQEIVVAPDGSELYVVNENGNLEIHNLQTGARAATVFLGGQPFGLAMTADNLQLYVSQMSAGTVSVVDRQTRAVVKVIPTGGIPRHIAFSFDGGTAIITNEADYVTFVQ
jgi:YVTN family beta-propeller protein